MPMLVPFLWFFEQHLPFTHCFSYLCDFLGLILYEVTSIFYQGDILCYVLGVEGLHVLLLQFSNDSLPSLLLLLLVLHSLLLWRNFWDSTSVCWHFNQAYAFYVT